MRGLVWAGLFSLAVVPGRAANTIRSDSNLVLVHTTVVDRADRFDLSLRASDFRLFDHGTEQRIASFSVEDVPMSIIVVFDASGSMAKSLPLAQQALREFLATSNPEDEFSMVMVETHPELAIPFVRRPEPVVDRLGRTGAGGRTALFDAVYLAASQARRARNPRRMLLVISDGEDNNSRYTEEEVHNLLRETDATLYSIGVGIRVPAYAAPDEQVRTGADILTAMAEDTGGRYFEAGRPKDLAEIFKRIDIRYQYVLGYAPNPLFRDGRYHKLEVKLAKEARRQGLRAFCRPGYYAPMN